MWKRRLEVWSCAECYDSAIPLLLWEHGLVDKEAGLDVPSRFLAFALEFVGHSQQGLHWDPFIILCLTVGIIPLGRGSVY